MQKMCMEARAKVNLTMDVLRRRADGYHEVDLLMQSVSLHDTLTIEESDALVLTIEGNLPVEDNNLVLRAARLLAADAGIEPKAKMHLVKRIPVAAGLGGGSADVAALLRILRDAYAPELSTETLQTIGLTVGSDMPFCVRGGTALAEGRGEILTDLNPLPECVFVLCKPDFGIPTPMLFARVDGEELIDRPDIDGMMQALETGDLFGVAARLGNVFEEVLPEEFREVYEIKQNLLDLGALNAAMSGSGPTVFGVFADLKTAQSAVLHLKERYEQTYLAEPVRKF